MNCPYILFDTRRFAFARTVVLAVSLQAVCLQLQAQELPLDEQLSGWSIQDFTAAEVWGPGNFTVDSGAVTMATAGVVPADQTGIADALCLRWIESENEPMVDGQLRARIRLNTDESQASVALRNREEGTYFFGVGGATQDLRLNLFQTMAQPLAAVPFSTTAGDEIYLSGAVVGDELALKAWHVGEPEPAQPQLIFNDDTLTDGALGFCAGKSDGVAGQVSATFSEVEFTAVPEPNALSTVGVGLAMLALSNRRRKSADVR